MLSVERLNVILLSVVRLKSITLSFVWLNVVILGVDSSNIVLSVLATAWVQCYKTILLYNLRRGQIS
jgi:hypothetical protein